MIGAIIGDIVGSRFEFKPIKRKAFNFLYETCRFTDDSVMTLAVGLSLLDKGQSDEDIRKYAIHRMQQLGQAYPHAGYGAMFLDWVFSDDPKPYESYGNGAAMRVSSCGIVAKSLEEVKRLSQCVTEVSHNHPEGLKGAEAIAIAVYLARAGKSKQEIYNDIKDFYDLGFSIDEIRPMYRFTEKNHETVPQALVCFFESSDFEDAIRLAVSLGGDSDTLAAITGSIAAEYYGVPKWMHYKAKTYLTQELREYLSRFERLYPPKLIDKVIKERPFYTNLRP